MLTKLDREIAEEFKKSLENKFNLIDIRVYGSRARGEFSEDSDMDIFIEVDQITPETRKLISEIAWEVGYRRNRIISTFVATPLQIEEGPLGAHPIIFQIEREGVPI
ncbi:nucleotidyltransferase domain-containing protein [Candidatus Sumerlaeota bacterium]|nr:nucleotidyltransferase domain-containing protein [Candidatus Sumerlaeota bacterium]